MIIKVSRPIIISGQAGEGGVEGGGRIAVFSVTYSVQGWPLKAGRGHRRLGGGAERGIPSLSGGLVGSSWGC